MKLGKSEIARIKLRYPHFDLTKVKPSKELRGKELACMLVIGADYQEKELNCYFVKVLALDWESPPNFYSLGWHDCLELVKSTTCMDCLGKNIFRIWGVRTLQLHEEFVSNDQLTIYAMSDREHEMVR